MNYISTELQRRIMFIPVVNFGNIFIAFLNCTRSPRPVLMGSKVGIRFTCSVLPVCIFWSILSVLFPQLEELFWLCFIYTGPLCMSYGLIKLQEKELL